MKFRKNILQYFENVAQSIRKMEKGSEVFAELKNISAELEVLEQYVKTTLDTLENNFNSFVNQINLLSELIDFQRSVIRFKNSENMMQTLFGFLQRNVRFDYGFIAFKLNEDDKEDIIITNREEYTETYKNFSSAPEANILKSLIKERDMAYLITDAQQFYGDKIKWELISAKSLILFPIKVRGKFLGVGYLIRNQDSFNLQDLSFINLNIGIISLLIYQHFYFAELKSRLFKQFRLKKILEEVKYAEFFEKGPLFIFTLDPRFVVLHANTAAMSKLAVESEMLIGENLLEIIPKSHRAGFQKAIEMAGEGKVSYYQSPVISKNGIEPIFEFFISKIELQNHFSLILVFALEVTQNYYREIWVRRNEILDELDQFSRTIVGEINNLLTIIVPNISLMRTRLPATHPHQVHLEAIEQAAKRSANLVQKFLNYDLEDFEAPKVGNINSVISSFISSFKKQISSNVEIKFQFEPGLKKVYYYPLRLRQLLKILLTNSLEALEGREKGLIRVSTKLINQKRDGLLTNKKYYLKTGDYIELCVYDNGCGISEASLPQVFKPFYSTKIKNEGVGLGLFIAYNIVKDMKGEIFIESKEGEYTSVNVYLPIKEEKEMEVLMAEEKVPAVKKKHKKPTVLVIDDEYNIRSMMKEIMEMHGFNVYTAGNGRDGVEVFQRYRDEIDLVVLDMVMPVMDGKAAFIEITKIKPDQKVFIISGYSSREDLEDILKRGAIGYMRKPFQVNEIISKIKEILNLESD